MKFLFILIGLISAVTANGQQHHQEEGMESEGKKAIEYFRERDEIIERFNELNGVRQKNRSLLNYQALKGEQISESYNSLNGGWTNISQAASTVGMGRAECIDFHPTDPSTFYVGTAGGGLWKTTDGGNNYVPLTDNIPCGGIADVVVNPVTPTIIYILTGAGLSGQSNPSIGIFKSTDGGVSWNATGFTDSVTNNQVPLHGYKLAMQPGNTNVLFACTNFGLYKTTDGGDSWRLVLSGFNNSGLADICDIEFKPDEPSTVYASGYGNYFYRSKQQNGDSATWIGSASTTAAGPYPAIGITGYFMSMIAVTPNAPGSVYLLSAVEANSPNINGDIFLSKYMPNAAGNMVPTTAPITVSCACADGSPVTPVVLGYRSGGGRAYGNIYVDDDDSTNIIVGGVDFFASTNTGANWTVLTRKCSAPYTGNFHVDVSNIEANDDIIYICSDGGVYSQFENYTSSTAFWYDVSGNIEITQPYAIDGSPQDADYYLYGTQDNGVHVRTHPAAYNIFIGGDGTACKFDQTDKDIFYGTIQNGEFFRKSNHGAVTGMRVPGPSCNCPDSALYSGTFEFSKCFMIDENIHDRLYYMKRDFYYSIDGGSNWIRKPTGQANPHLIMKVAKSNNQYMYVLRSNGFMAGSTDFGNSWDTVIKPFSDLVITDIAIDKSNPSIIYITCAGNVAGKKVFRSTDGGATNLNWTNLSTGLPNVDINTVEIDGTTNDVYVGTNIGVYVRPNGANRWISFNNGIARTQVKDLYINPTLQTISAGTFGRGIWRSNLYSSASCLPYRQFGGPFVEHYTGSALDSAHGFGVIEATAEANVKFTAQNHYVRMSDGFWAKRQSTFKAAIEPCGGNVDPYIVNRNNDSLSISPKQISAEVKVNSLAAMAASLKQDSLAQAQKNKLNKPAATTAPENLAAEIEADKKRQEEKEQAKKSELNKKE